MNTIEAITSAIAELPPEQVAQIREWLNERAESDCIQHGTQSKTKPVRPLLLLQGPETQALL